MLCIPVDRSRKTSYSIKEKMKKRQRNDVIDNDDNDRTNDYADDDDGVTHTPHNNSNHNDDDSNDDDSNDDDDDDNNSNYYDDEDMVAEYKNNKNSPDDDDEDDDHNDDEDDIVEGDAQGEETENDHSSKGIQENKEQQMTSKAASKKQKLSIRKAMEYNEQMSQRGIIYVARIPPHMTPMKMKHLLSMYGTTVTRIFCQLDTTTSSHKNKKGPKRYVEGWVEFDNKKIAKQIAASLHQQRISNIKRNIHYDDYWCMKYLGSQFAWSILTEKVAYEKRIREQKLRMETIHDRKQIQHYQQAYMTNHHIQQRRIESHENQKGNERKNKDSIE